MTIYITYEIKAAYVRYLDEAVDADIRGTPILRRHTEPFNSSEFVGLVDFAAGWQGGRASIFGATKQFNPTDSASHSACGCWTTRTNGVETHHKCMKHAV